MAVRVGSARINERGGITGGANGDQTGMEVAGENWYLHSKGWVVIRAKDDTVREKIAVAMEGICDNNNIGYDQNNRNGLYNAVRYKGFNPYNCTVKTACDCSSAVRVCVHYAGITCGDFNTASERSVLQSTGRFDILTDSKYCNSSSYLKRGDILVTRTQGHTVVVLTNGANANSNTSSGSTSGGIALPTLRKGSTGDQVRLLQENLNKAIGAGLSVDGDFGNNTYNALRSFQSKYGLGVDGIYGNQSYNTMKAVLSNTNNNTSSDSTSGGIALPTLRKGSIGDQVRLLQENLNKAIGAGLVVDGIFGNGTYNALKSFQSRYGLGVDGIYGNQSYNKMKTVLSTNRPEVAVPTLRVGSKGTQVRNLQLDLNYLLGSGLIVDGDFGNNTKNALMTFQRKYGLGVDGIYGNQSYNKMKELL